jgi:anti-sigma B factor antagonist
VRAFRLVENDVQPECRRVDVEGELDLAVADQLREALERAPGHVLVGLEGCEFIDSTGIAVIVQAHRALGEKGRRLAVFGPSDQVLRVLTMTGLTDNGLVFQSFDQAQEAAVGVLAE